MHSHFQTHMWSRMSDYSSDESEHSNSDEEEDVGRSGDEETDDDDDDDDDVDDDGDDNADELLETAQTSVENLLKQLDSLDKLDMQLPSGSVEINVQFITQLEEALSSYVAQIRAQVSNIEEELRDLTVVLVELINQRQTDIEWSEHAERVNRGYCADESIRRGELRQAAADRIRAEKYSDQIDEILSAIKTIDEVNLQERLTNANSRVKWLKVFVFIVSAEFKPGEGNAAHPTFLNNNDPEGNVLTPGLLLELFVTMIFFSWKKEAIRVGGANDGGVDIWVGPRHKIPCQVKNYTSRMGPAVVRELLGTMVLRNVKTAYMVYSQGSDLTNGVKQVVNQALDRGYKIHILTNPQLVELIKEYCLSFSSDKLVFNTGTFDAEFELMSEAEIDKIGEAFDELVQKINSLD